MRKGWEYKKLGEIAKCAIGLTYKPENVTEELSGTIVLRSSNIQNSILDFNDIVRVNVPVKEDKIVKDGDILMCSRNGSIRLVGKVALIKNLKERMSYGAFMTIIRSQYNPYLFEYFKTPAFRQYLIAGKTTTVNQITVKMLNNLTIPLPPKSTQLAIVSELDKINELIRLKKEQLKDFDNLAQSLFYEMFGDPVENEKGWEVKKLNEIVSDNCSISYGIVQPGDGVENGVPVVRPVDMTKTFVSRKGLKNTTKEISDSYKRTILKGNEILMCVRGTTGLISMATPELQGCNVTRGIAPIECGPTCDKWFIFYQILNPAIQHHIAEYTRGIALKQINMKDVRDIPLCLPPLPLQRLFAQRIEQIEREKSEVQKSIQDLETLLASRMQYWFE